MSVPAELVLQKDDQVLFDGLTIYNRPSDLPGVLYAVRRWAMVRGPGDRAVQRFEAQCSWIADTLDDARLRMPAGRVNVGRYPQDDPAIVETWI